MCEQRTLLPQGKVSNRTRFMNFCCSGDKTSVFSQYNCTKLRISNYFIHYIPLSLCFALGFLPRDTAKHHRENVIDILKR